jgi:hypothetical protein
VSNNIILSGEFQELPLYGSGPLLECLDFIAGLGQCRAELWWNRRIRIVEELSDLRDNVSSSDWDHESELPE